MAGALNEVSAHMYHDGNQGHPADRYDQEEDAGYPLAERSVGPAGLAKLRGEARARLAR
jgi:hypothetical protein